ELGCHASDSLAGITARADVIITVVSDDAAMREIFGTEGEGASLFDDARGKLFINCATISPQTHIEVEKRAREAGAQTLEACMASRGLQTDGEDMQNREHSCFFSAAHAAKDSGIALALAREAGLDLPLAAATKNQYDRMVAEGLGELDKSGVAELTFKGRGKST